jgi:hypothetical protein
MWQVLSPIAKAITAGFLFLYRCNIAGRLVIIIPCAIEIYSHFQSNLTFASFGF